MISNPFKLAPRIPENLEKAIENMIAKSEEVNYDPENDTNWMDLPKEMKKEIVDRMDFLSRIQLAATAKDEKTLAEAKKYTLNGLEIRTHGRYLCFRAYNIVGNRLLRKEFTLKKRNGSGEWLKQATIEIFEKCEIQSFAYNTHMIHPAILTNVLRNYAPFNFKRLVCCEDWHMNKFLLENCENLESISIDTFRLKPERSYDYEKIFNIPSVLNAKHLEVLSVQNLPGLHKIVENWINSDAEIDKSMEVMMIMDLSRIIDSFAEKFLGKIAEKTVERVRIRMENQSKQILIQKINNQLEHNFLIKVIPTGLPESEYKTVPFDKFKYSMPRYHLFLQYDDPKLPN